MPDETTGDPNKETMLEPKEGDAAELLPTTGGYEDSDKPTPDTETETVEADTETAEADTETDTGDDNPDAALLREHGIDATYKTIPSALAGVREKDRYIEQLRTGNQQLRDTLSQAYENRPRQSPLQTEDVAEQFANDPEAALRNMGYVSREQITPLVNQIKTVQAKLERQDFIGAVEQYDDLKDVGLHLRSRGVPPARGVSPIWDAMDDIYQNSPSLAGNMADLIPLLYDTAKSRLSTGAKVSEVSDNAKRGASTTSGGRGARRPSSGEPDFDKMSELEILNWHKDKGLVS